MNNFNFQTGDGEALTQMRCEIAQLAAKFIAEEGAEYGTAKRRAVKQLLGNHKPNGNILPDNHEIEQEVREYNALFYADTQPARLLQLRRVAAEFMQQIEKFHPYIVGAVFNGTAGAHSDIHLHLYTDNSKDVAIYLLNLGLDFEVSEQSGKRQEPIEILSFLYKNEGIHLSVYDFDDLRHTEKRERGSLQALRDLVDPAASI